MWSGVIALIINQRGETQGVEEWKWTGRRTGSHQHDGHFMAKNKRRNVGQAGGKNINGKMGNCHEGGSGREIFKETWSKVLDGYGRSFKVS